MKKLLEVQNLKKYFPIRKGVFKRHVGDVKAVDDISFHILAGEVVGLVGESGSGKSTAGRTAIRLTEPTAGEIFLAGHNLTRAKAAELRALRSIVQMVFQDPLASLNPRKTILENVGEALLFHKKVRTCAEQAAAVEHILHKVGISSAALNQYPHQFSGGQQQRICIGRALILRPELIICDEITSALDLSIQAQVLNLLSDLKKSFNLSYLLISHDLAVVRHLCDRILVMYQGKIVEVGPTETIFNHPSHPYTQSLIEAAFLSSIGTRQPSKRSKSSILQ
jgi:ABC-type oligopeptide transport system ATPase subunit